ncbi:MAG: DUF5132 domain-containing protein [Candidatus Dormibacteraeota bacterium]|uniref:hypothetical protein n=1 Tax=Candidatus Dormibacter sp. TaxID=2973982 RepID=UPI000DB8811D|nr:DUF5132 domain-containing protein [Candidatus Dormibacteraeota bacterium]PZR66997.1 MAG: hypothetical protein DLM66_12165 [Candidatus Dormibacteraeota bacterium]
MFADLLEAVIPGGLYIGLGVAIGAAFSERLRPVAKRAVKVGMTGAERLQEISAEALEKAQDLVAEARYEQVAEQKAPVRRTRATARTTTPRRPRRRTAAGNALTIAPE